MASLREYRGSRKDAKFRNEELESRKQAAYSNRSCAITLGSARALSSRDSVGDILPLPRSVLPE